MTDEERKNRNPPVEYSDFHIEEHPELKISDLELYRVYILQGRTTIRTFNYMGSFLHGGVVYHYFNGPRANLNIFLRERPDRSGTLEDGRGIKVTLRKYNGPDA